ncbi:hypothetical protein VTJ83DRAFT_3799 [Remersonia thermophila]|uniref:TauD/TfdA-like domain-containing protein n=1 Tax=Remersonia thermophila TaxID=72144 RepID=A0ABR4DF17_9PEZI
MAPGILVDEPQPAAAPVGAIKRNDGLPRELFPDGIRTSGQHPPLYDQLKPYSAFPQTITGPTVWQRSDFEGHPERWVHRFTADEIAELSSAADAFLASGVPLTGIAKELFPLPAFSQTLHTIRNDLLNGKGFVLFKGFPVDQWTIEKTATAYMGLGTHLGYPVSQNSRGHVLGHVKDVGDDPTQIHSVRIYRTAARQFFHADEADFVGLLCLHRAQEGGESDIVSVHNVWNVLQREHPDVAELLTKPIWYFDRKGELSQGQDEWIRKAVFYLERDDKQDGTAPRVYAKWDPYFIKSLQRFWDAGVVPPLSDEQKRAAEILEQVCQREALHMILEVGDIQIVANSHLLHARTAYKDFAPPAPRRHLMRLWLSTPEDEGGWALPFPDSHEKKRGGVQVDNTPPKAPLDAE